MIAFILFLCWGSFLNALGYRLIKHQSLFTRSQCPHCNTTLAWYDLIPVLSWILLLGKCRYCKEPISLLYPFIELLTAVVLQSMIWYREPTYWFAYGLFFSALIVTIRTDLEFMLISRYMTWGMLPLAYYLSIRGALPITIQDSLFGTLFGYGLLWIIAQVFYRLRKLEGMGQGDLDLLAMIGAYTGLLGAWFSLFIGSCLGSIYGLAFAKDNKIPFGPWLALGGIMWVFFGATLVQLINPS